MAKYLRKDFENGYMSDNAYIEYFKKVQEIDIINNLMIGDFNSKGEYVTTKEILNEFLQMPKYIVKTFNTNMYLESNAELNGFKQFSFMITVQDGVPKANLSRASLILTEDVIKCAGLYINTNSVVLDTFEDVNDFDFNEKMFTHFKVFDQGAKRINKSEIPLNILNRITSLNNIKESLFDSVLKAQKDYLDRRLSVYKRFEIGAQIVKEYTTRLTKMKAKYSLNDAKFVYHQNELLDMVLEEFDYKKDRAFNKAVLECFEFYNQNAQSLKLTSADSEKTNSRTKIKETLN